MRTPRRVLVTGAVGLVGLPVVVKLARDNRVYAVARFSDPEQQRLVKAGRRNLVEGKLGIRHCVSPGSKPAVRRLKET